VLLPNHTAEEVIQFAERLRERIAAVEFVMGGSSAHITVSMVSFMPSTARHSILLLRRRTELSTGQSQRKNELKSMTKAPPDYVLVPVALLVQACS